LRNEVIDPRLIMVKKHLSSIKNILAVSSGKGGVGKSVIATTMSLLLARKGKDVGLLDLDFYGPSCLKILGSDIVFPEEEKGIIPPIIEGLKVMSIEYFTRDNPLPIRGDEITNAIIELLAITVWGDLDYLIIDLPPGMGDELLEIIKLIPKSNHIVVTTPSILSVSVVRRLITLLKNANENILGGIVNMVRGESEVDIGINFLGKIIYDEDLDNSLGNTNELLKTRFAKDLQIITDKVEESLKKREIDGSERR